MEEDYVSKPIMKVEYRFDNDNMSDEEYSNQEEMEFIITKDMIIELMHNHIKLENGNSICEENLYVSKIK